MPVMVIGQPASTPSLLHMARRDVPILTRPERATLAGAHGRVQVDEEGEDVHGEDEGDEPLEDGGRVEVVREVAGDEGDGEDDFDDNEGELNEEGEAEDAVFAVVWRGRRVLAAFQG